MNVRQQTDQRNAIMPATGFRIIEERSLRRAGMFVVLLFWAIQFVELTLVSAVEGWPFAVRVLPQRVLIVGIGFALTLLLLEVTSRLRGQPLRRQLGISLAITLILCAIQVVAAYFVEAWAQAPHRRFDAVGFIYTGFTFSWFFLSVATALVALRYSQELREREGRLAALEIVARDARMAALRYQLNPHFLFNTLNSIAALIGRGDNVAAEQMVENLADFLRATLELDPHADIPLRSEIELQARYLAIEQVRFGERLDVRYDVPEALGDVPVPALITQPLVENAIRHAVARTAGPVTLTIAACTKEGRLLIAVADNGRPTPGRASPGTGVGLENVRARLTGRFGAEQGLTAKPLPGGGFRAEIELPLSNHA